MKFKLSIIFFLYGAFVMGQINPIEVNKEQLLLIQFPKKIKSVNLGDDIMLETSKVTENTLEVRVAKKITQAIFVKTNFMVFLNDGQVYSFLAKYNKEIIKEIYLPNEIKASKLKLLVPKKSYQVIKNTDTLKREKQKQDSFKSKIVAHILQDDKMFYSAYNSSNGIAVQYHDMFTYKDDFFIKISLDNQTNFSYEVANIKLESSNHEDFSDASSSSNEEVEDVSDELKVFEYEKFYYEPIVKAKKTNTYILLLKKYRLDTKKFFRINIEEKGGERHIILNIKSKYFNNPQAVKL